MGLLDGLLGGAVGAEMATVVNSLIQQHGGIQGIVAQLEKEGLGGTARSWIGTGPNQPISADQLQQVFGSDTLGQLAARRTRNTRQAFFAGSLPSGVSLSIAVGSACDSF